VLVVWPEAAARLADGGLARVSIYYDSVRGTSGNARVRLGGAIRAFRRGLVDERERALGLSPGFSIALETADENVASSERRTGGRLGSLLPFLLILFSVLSGLYTAIDVTAGEKERGTMQTLLCAPLSPTEIIAGKFLAVWTLSLAASLVNMVSLAITVIPLSQSGGAELSGLELLRALSLTFVLILPATFMVSALFLAVATFARDFKDGQNLLTPATLGMLAPLGAAMAPGIEANAWTLFIPLTNVALVARAVFVGEAKLWLIVSTLLISLVYAWLALLFAARVFHQETLLLGGKVSLSRIFGMERRSTGSATPGLAMLAFAVTIVLGFYGQLALRESSVPLLTLCVEVGFFLLPALLLARGLRLPLRETFRLRAPAPRQVLASVMLGLTAWTVAASLSLTTLPPPESLVKSLQQMVLLDGYPAALPLALVLFALVPALCEEMLFRGLILSGLARLGALPALVISALLFGLAHASIYRFIPTFVLGLCLGYAVWSSRSIWVGVIVHSLNNAVAVLAVHVPSLAALDEAGTGAPAWPITLAGLGVTLAALALLRASSAHECDLAVSRAPSPRA